MSYVFVLGAVDNEMVEIEDLLIRENIPYLYSFYGGTRVNSATASHANFIGRPDGTGNIYFDQLRNIRYVFVECSYFHKGTKATGVRIDHHNVGDRGYDKGPESYWEGSSLGQVVWFIQNKMKRKVRITDRMRYTAAADHCLGYAYQGHCPGINPELLKVMRLEDHSKYNGQTIFDAACSMERTYGLIENSPTFEFEGHVINVVEGEPSLLRDAACYYGKAVLATKLRPDGSKFLYLFGYTSKQMVADWLQLQQMQPGFDRYYGNPNRGYASVILKPVKEVKEKVAG